MKGTMYDFKTAGSWINWKTLHNINRSNKIRRSFTGIFKKRNRTVMSILQVEFGSIFSCGTVAFL